MRGDATQCTSAANGATGSAERAEAAQRVPAVNEPAAAEAAPSAPAADRPAGRAGEWAALGEWLASPPPLHEVDLDVLQECLGFVGRARSSLAALEAQLVAEVARREGDAAAEEVLRRGQKRSRRGARKAVKTAGQLEWAPTVAGKLAEGAITPEAAALILDADAEGDVDQRHLLEAAESEPEDLFRRTLKDHVNERTSEQELERRREQQRRRRRAGISEQPDGMFHLFAQFDPLTGAGVQATLIAKTDELFRAEDSGDRPTPPQRSADALAELIATGAGTPNSDGAGSGSGPRGVDLLVLADYDVLCGAITNYRLADGTRLTVSEALAVGCDANLLMGVYDKNTGETALGRSQRKISKRHRKQLIARDGGCVGCAAHHQICEVHHLRHWAHGGQTTLENTCLLCWRCHHIRVHQNGEEVTRHPGGRFTLGYPTTAPARSGREATRQDNSRGGSAGGEEPTGERDGDAAPRRGNKRGGVAGDGRPTPARSGQPASLPPPPHEPHPQRHRPPADRNRPAARPDRPADPRQRLPLDTPIPRRR